MHGQQNVKVSSKVFQAFFFQLVCNSALFLTACCCSFLLHVVANLICLFFISLQLVLLSVLPVFLLRSTKCAPCCSSEKFHFYWCQSFLSFFLSVQISLPYKRTGRVNALYTVMLGNFRTKFGLKVLFRVPSIWENFVTFVEYALHFHRNFITEIYEILYL